MKKKVKKGMIITLSIIAAIVLGVVIFMQTPRFGKHPSGDRLAKVEASDNYKEGQFKNLVPTPMMTGDVNYGKMLIEFFTNKPAEPEKLTATKKIDLKNLDPNENALVWMGHSSYFIQIDGKKILVDPVLSGYASPVSFTTNAYEGSDVYTTEDIPNIDYLFITHDHWDHLDKNTVLKLKDRIVKVVTPLGNGEHFERWGFDKKMILEDDWYKSIILDNGFTAHVTPTRHFSGRGLKRNQALWGSFVLETPSSKIYIGGDGGYGEHFAEIGKKYGPIDLAILENGQYDEKWKHIHMMPEEVLVAVKDLNAKTLLPVHSGKFTLGNHDWDEPLSRISKAYTNHDFRMITPMIGELVNLTDSTQSFTQWWKGVN